MKQLTRRVCFIKELYLHHGLVNNLYKKCEFKHTPLILPRMKQRTEIRFMYTSRINYLNLLTASITSIVIINNVLDFNF